MQTKNILSVVVGVILLMAVAIPIINGVAGSMTDTDVNGGNSNRFEAGNLDIEVIDISTNAVEINGQDIIIGSTEGYSAFRAFSDGLVMQYSGGSFKLFDIIGGTIYTLETGDKLSATNGAWTLSGSATASGTYSTDLLYSDVDGSWGGFVNVGANVTIGQQIYAYSGSPFEFVYGVAGSTNATIGYAKTISGSTLSDYTGQVDASLTATALTDNEHSVLCQFNVTNTPSGGSASAVSMTMIAPLEYVTNADGTVKTLIDIIPIVLAVGLILGIVYSFVLRRE